MRLRVRLPTTPLVGVKSEIDGGEFYGLAQSNIMPTARGGAPGPYKLIEDDAYKVMEIAPHLLGVYSVRAVE
ncbi:MAG: hypothetical protein AMJ73_04080 [candidate division Zixibacteria bacterium SM1_73]|nr:MAG: hypothetical protein AMJ73_04080 [candidate division Zixibacteria bacterium SM1_73]